MKHAYVMMIALASACGVERGDGRFDDQQIPDAGPTVDVGTGSDVGLGEGQGAGTMSGTWILAHEGSTCVLNTEQLTHAYYLVVIDQNERILEEQLTLCRQDYSELLGLTLVLPEAARESIVFTPLDQGLVSDLRVGGSYSSSTISVLWGVDLEDPVNDELPEDADDPRVLDADNDGQPGITFKFEGSDCERYTAQKQLFRFNGRFVTPNSIEGGSVNLTEIEVYDSSQPLCGVAPTVRSNDAFSKFRMVRVDGLGGSLNADQNGDSVVDCAEVMPLLDSVISRREATIESCERE